MFQKSISHFPGRIERPLCSNCKTVMMLARLTPGRDGFELQCFDCPKCNHELTVEIAELDPLKKAEGWLSGELGQSLSDPKHPETRPADLAGGGSRLRNS